jgi:hypothetical protein
LEYHLQIRLAYWRVISANKLYFYIQITTIGIELMSFNNNKDKKTELIEDNWKAYLLKILVDKYFKVIKKNINKDILYLDLNAFIAAFIKSLYNGY